MSAAGEGEFRPHPPIPSYFNPKEKATSIHLTGGWVCSRASMNTGKRQKSAASARDRTLPPWISSLQPSHYTGWATCLRWIIVKNKEKIKYVCFMLCMQCDGKEAGIKHWIQLCLCSKSREQNFCLGLELRQCVCVCVCVCVHARNVRIYGTWDSIVLQSIHTILGPTQPPIQWVLWRPTSGVKGMGREVFSDMMLSHGSGIPCYLKNHSAFDFRVQTTEATNPTT